MSGDADTRTSKLAAYYEALRRADEDALHDAIVSKGVNLLDRSVPFILRAARWRKISAERKKARRQGMLDASHEELAPPKRFWDPLEGIQKSAELALLAQVLEELDDEDHAVAMAVASGLSHAEVAEEWAKNEQLPQPPPNETALRKKRSRVLEALKETMLQLLGESAGASGD